MSVRFPLVLALLGIAGCQESRLGSLELKLSGVAAVEAPREFPAATDSFQYSVLRTGGQGSGGLVLQGTPALFSSPGNEIGRRLCAILPAGMTAGSWDVFKFAVDKGPFEYRESPDGRLMLWESGKPVLGYNFGIQSPEGVPEDRWRSTYVHPVYDLSGSVLTDDFPDDHPHHRGLSWMWPRVAVGSELYDLWHIRGVYQRFEEWLGKESGPVCATFGVKNYWTLEDRRVMDEWVWIRVFREGQEGRAIDVALTWEALEPVALQGESVKGYGGLCFRLAPRTETEIYTPKGLLAEDSDLVPSPWADQSGFFGGRKSRSGVAVFQYPGNPGFPVGWCLRHYGFLGVSWPGQAMVVLGPNESLTLRFRIWIHRGGAAEGLVPEAYAAFTESATVRLDLER